MADNPALDSFLAAGAQEGAAQPPQEPVQAPEPADPLIDPQAWAQQQKPPTTKPEATAKAPEAKEPTAKEPEPEPEDEALQHVQGGDNRTVPFSALEKVRNDWKSKAAAEKAKADLLAQQLEEFKRAQQAPAPQPQPPPQYQLPPMPDPQTDLYGYLRYQEVVRERQLLNERLNLSEAFVTDKIGEDKLREYVTEFKQHADKDQALWNKLYNQPNPYGWMIREMDRLRQHAEIGDDPAAFRARVEAELRAKWEAEMLTPQAGNGAARPSPVAGMAPSLANARSVAGRTTTTFTGPPSFDDILRRPDRSASRH
jgi:hypothetical protein